ncbi:hypothetical protein [Streptomyces sp. NBC_01304]|uniref:hypothetical protein n=1 Tax=Streptomyces sp. NBC_01304 TaxID=2903818 RepID=UPI002E1383C8|nr:hypothetical protein OG430_46635 [Streptomyces sp. NBC_01304]
MSITEAETTADTTDTLAAMRAAGCPAAAAAAAAEAEAEDTSDLLDPSPTGELIDGRPRPTTLDEYAEGDESDRRVVLGWLGPAFDETGELRGPLPASYVVAESNGWPKKEGEAEAAKLNEALLTDFFERDGLLGAVFGVSDKNWNSSRALTIWEDNASLDVFLNSEEHQHAVRRMKDIAYTWEGIRWTSDSPELPTFDDVAAKLAEQRAERRKQRAERAERRRNKQ